MSRWLLRLYDAVITAFAWAAFSLALSLCVARDTRLALDTPERVRAYIRDIEFDFVDWTLNAVGFKIRHASVAEQAFLPEAARSQLVRDYFSLVADLQDVERAIAAHYADPSLADPAAATVALRAHEADLRARAQELQPLAEAVLQEQISVSLAEQGLVVGGQPLPPVSFHFTPLPLALVVSPRHVIRQDANLDVAGDLTLEQQVALEDRVAHALDVSTLVVPLGGVGTYPAMVAQNSDLNWIASVTAHEWAHNYLTLRPLGVNYFTSGELRTMNETTAEMVGEEIGALVIERYYPERVPPPPPFRNFLRRDQPPDEPGAPRFDFRAEMRATRVRVDELLAEGKIEAAEAFMEARRAVFWENGYQIRKLNQAYFAFYGAYEVGGGGAAGVDPVPPAVRLLRRRSPTVKDFLDTMAVFTSFEQLQAYLGMR
jgi:hypothetical protein